MVKVLLSSRSVNPSVAIRCSGRRQDFRCSYRSLLVALVSALFLTLTTPAVLVGQTDSPQQTVGNAVRIKLRSTPFSFDDVDAQWLSGWLRRFGLKLPDNIRGKLSTELDVRWPFGALTDPKRYEIDGAIQSEQLQVGPLTLTNVDATVQYREGVAELTSLSCNLLRPADETSQATVGSIDGSGSIELLPLDKITLNLSADKVLLEFIAEQLGLTLPKVKGKLAGEIQINSSYARSGTIDGWRGQGILRGKDLSIAGRPGVDLQEAKFSLRDGQLKLTNMRATTDGGSISAKGQSSLKDEFPWEADIHLDGFDLEALPRWLVQQRLNSTGSVTGQLKLAGTLAPLSWNGEGELSLEKGSVEGVRVASARMDVRIDAQSGRPFPVAAGRLIAKSIDATVIGQSKLDSVEMNYRLTDQAAIFDNIEAELNGGRFSGNVSWPWNSTEIAKAEGNWTDVDLGLLLPSFNQSKTPFIIKAISDGNFTWSAIAGQLQDVTQHRLNAKATIPQVDVNGIPSGNLSAVISRPADVLRYELEGQLFDGKIAAQGTLAGSDVAASSLPASSLPASESRGPATGTIDLRDLNLGLLAHAILRDSGRQWKGSISLTANTWVLEPRMQGTLKLQDLQFRNTKITERLRGDFLADGSRVQLGRLFGRSLDGQLRADGSIDYAGRGSFNLQLSKAAFSAVAEALYPTWGDYFDGRVDIAMRASGQQGWRATGTVTGAKTEIGPFAIQSLRIPVLATLSPTGRLTVQSRSISASLLNGRVTGEAKLGTSNAGLGLESDWKFQRIGLQKISKQLGGNGAIGTGDLTGTVSVFGQRIRGFRDLKGSIRASIHDARAQSLPLVPQLQRFIVGANVSSTRFDEGLLIAKLGKGQVSLKELRLASSQLAIFAEGKYIPFTNRLSLEITASTAEYTAENSARKLLIGNLSAVTPITAAMATVSEIISDRVIQLHVDGTVRSPKFTLRPLPTLKQEALRFFIRQLVPELLDLKL